MMLVGEEIDRRSRCSRATCRLRVGAPRFAYRGLGFRIHEETHTQDSLFQFRAGLGEGSPSNPSHSARRATRIYADDRATGKEWGPAP
jgi:hypothetical protein